MLGNDYIVSYKKSQRVRLAVLGLLFKHSDIQPLASRVGIVPADKGVGGQYQENYAHVEGS